MYGKNNGDDFYYLLNNGKQKNVFQCNVIVYPAPYDKEIDLSLTTAATWGETMQLAPKMGVLKKENTENYLKKIFYQK